VLKTKTMWDRSKENGGYMAGPEHALLRNAPKTGMGMAKPKEVSEEEGGGEPPNLRDGMTEAPICGTCDHFSGGEGCTKFKYPCRFHETCDEHSDMASAEDSEEEESAAPAEEDSEE